MDAESSGPYLLGGERAGRLPCGWRRCWPGFRNRAYDKLAMYRCCLPRCHKCLDAFFRWRPALLLTFVLGCSTACSHQRAETARQLELMNERLLILQNDRDRLVERVDALEARATERAAAPEPAGPAVASRPPLKVIKLHPSGEADELPPAVAGTAADELSSKADDGASALPATAPANEPRVVLYGEGPASGVRAVAAGEEP